MKRLVFAVLLAACGSDRPVPEMPAQDAAPVVVIPDAKPDGPVLDHAQMVELCLQTGDTVCKQSQTCEVQPYAVCYGDYELNCPYIVRVRDYNELVNECLPWMASLTCEFINSYDYRLIPACKKQFVVDRPTGVHQSRQKLFD